jgi:hypothetical protein
VRIHASDARDAPDVAALLQGAPGSRVVLAVSRIRTHNSSNGEFVQKMEETFSEEPSTSLTFCQRMQRCQEACSKLQTIVQEDVLAAPRYSCCLPHDGLRSTLGDMLLMLLPAADPERLLAGSDKSLHLRCSA